MSTFGDEFINLASTTPGRDGRTYNALGAASDERRGVILRQAIDDLQTLYGGGYLYFPPGRYGITRGLVVPENITLYFSPGAYLVPSAADPSTEPSIHPTSADIVVFGSIIAGRHQIMTPAYWPARKDLQRFIRDVSPFLSADWPVNTEIPGMGRLLLLGNQVPEVFPEWFGAQTYIEDDLSGLLLRYQPRGDSLPDGGRPMDFVDSTAALQAALDCAHRHRGLRAADRPAQPDLPALPVVLSGRYLVARALRVGLRDDDDPQTAFGRSLCKPFVLRGPSGPGGRDKPALRPHPNYPRMPKEIKSLQEAVFNPDATLLYVRGPTGFLLEDIAFNGRAEDADSSLLSPTPPMTSTAVLPCHQDLRVHSCLRIERPQGLASDLPVNEPASGKNDVPVPVSRVRRCHFEDTRGCLVQLGAREHPSLPLDARSQTGDWRQDLRALTLEGCQFVQQIKGHPPWPDGVTAEVTIPVDGDLRVLRAARGTDHRDVRWREPRREHSVRSCVDGTRVIGV